MPYRDRCSRTGTDVAVQGQTGRHADRGLERQSTSWPRVNGPYSNLTGLISSLTGLITSLTALVTDGLMALGPTPGRLIS